ncbi:MAG: hypothetical protein MUE95_04930 [Cyclobacteriaceae bacterium]|jgi:hypothetical protein|nr:hypothetical protein [Cyclobacteriaceae bacterium]
MTFTSRLLAVALLLVQCISYAQAQPSNNRLKLFMDCSNTWCDLNFIRTEINIVDFVVDRMAADVHALVTSQTQGNGGDQYQIIFYGQKRFSSMRDTLRFSVPPVTTEVEVRERLVNHLKFGLVPFIAKTDMINYMSIGMRRPDSTMNRTVDERDSWNYWVFRVGANGNMSLDQNYLNTNLNSSLSANRTTEETRAEFRLSTGRNRAVYKYEDENGVEQSFTVINTSYNLNHTLVLAINDHWSYGYYLFLRNSTFSNFQNSVRLIPAMEYNIFPYKEVNNKYLAFGYGIELTHNNYYEETLYNKMEESLLGHSARLVSRFNQKWGSLNGSIYYNNFWHDWSLYSIELNLEADVRVTGNLSFYVYAFGGVTRNQVFIPKGSASPEDVLTRRRQLASNYNFGMWFGINYRFGSMLNNFVNPRFTD